MMNSSDYMDYIAANKSALRRICGERELAFTATEQLDPPLRNTFCSFVTKYLFCFIYCHNYPLGIPLITRRCCSRATLLNMPPICMPAKKTWAGGVACVAIYLFRAEYTMSPRVVFSLPLLLLVFLPGATPQNFNAPSAWTTTSASHHHCSQHNAIISHSSPRIPFTDYYSPQTLFPLTCPSDRRYSCSLVSLHPAQHRPRLTPPASLPTGSPRPPLQTAPSFLAGK